MKIGIVSDTHNTKHNTKVALEALRERGISQILHCGDITTPEIIYLFSGFRMTFVFGNMDSGWIELGEAANRIGAARPRQSQEIEIAGKLIGVTHGADYGLLAKMYMSGKYAYVCHGHTHQRRDEVRGAYSVRIINPGALGGNMPEARSICILDVAQNEVEFIEFPDLS